MNRVVVFLSSFVIMLAACSEKFKLISFSDGWDDDEAAWILVKPAREPVSNREDIAVMASKQRSTIREGALSAIFLETQTDQDLVATFETDPADSNPYAPKPFQFFLVSNGLITAYSDLVRQPAPDCEFVRAMHLAALAAVNSYNPVLLYDNDPNPVILSGKRLGKCLVRVDVFDGKDGQKGKRSMVPLFSNTENTCLNIRDR